ncbi:E3 ubiquitin-protein ligase BRE1-like 1 isoform X3 [Hevea brasiliensis]|uniref:E3 ubiquitin-protein ligase BRE1-like 1 isoform X3 n=1 Tax=Hevea brasiliensis TaxID=3981 RepID=UPI0025E98455|nr:E3 ubiquitin-protein ligase BRE1-like 1 isoform X3 [Hevea brasiliensis]
MGSTGEPDRKRRHFSSISPMAAMAKKQPFSQSSEDKKLDTAVLQFQNQKLVQKLEAQKVEYSALVNKFSQLKEKQQPNNSILKSVHKSWELLVTDLEACSTCTRESSIGQDIGRLSITEDGVSSSFEEAFLSRLVETGATETSSANDCLNSTEEHKENASEKIKNILCNIVAAINDIWQRKDGLHATVLNKISEDGADRQKESCGLVAEVKNLRLALSDLHLKHKSHARELQSCRDINAKNKAELKRLKGELESAVSELEESNLKMATLKAERDATKGTFFPVLNLGSKPVPGDRARDKQKNLQEMESALKELQDEASSRLLKLKGLHDERITILQQLSNLQDSLKNVKCISSSQAYRLLRDQLEKSKSEVFQYQALYEKLQVERDNLSLRENELNVKNDLVDLFRRSSAVVDSRIADLGIEIQRQINERHVIETKLEEASGELGRKEIIAEFKALVSSFPEAMGNMQRQLSTYKEATSDIHSLRADVQSLSTVLDRKVKECENLSTRSKNQVAEIQKLQSVVQDLKESDLELKLILEMYRFESTDSRDVMEAKDLEYKAWAQVQSLKSFLDEQNLELRVKTANEAEAISQQRLATTEADIADLRQRLEASKRDISRLSDVLKSKNEENEAYLSEIEIIGQAYDDMQTQNQHLLQQITERDDYNIKLVLEGVRARQLRNSLHMDKRTMEREIQQANISLDFYNVKAARIEDQVHKLKEEKFQNSSTLENTQKRLVDVRKSSNQARESLEDSQSKVGRSRAALLELQIELERERFDKRRIEEELEVARRKVSRLRAQTEGSSIVEKLQQELKEYREIVKCSICLERPKEVVITKCYHLFCNPCVQRIMGSRHRKCPACATSFGPNDVKPVYI